ncbi:hypothetical protein CCUS01_12176, partial [Colletotrichum cuscutae]
SSVVCTVDEYLSGNLQRGEVIQVEQPAAPGSRSRLPCNALPGGFHWASPLFSQRRTGQVCLVLTGHGKGARDDDGDPMLFTVELQCSCQDERVDTIPLPPLALQPRNQVDVGARSTAKMPAREGGGASQHFWALGRAGTRSGADNLTRDARRCLPVETLPPKFLT